MTWYTAAWLALIAFGLTVEGIALADKDPGDTASEHIWKWFGVKGKNGGGWTWKRYVLAALMVWLTGHFVWGLWAG